MEIRCCVCGKLRLGNTWRNAVSMKKEGALISHGYCPPCAKAAAEEIRAHRRTAAAGGQGR